MEKEFYKITTSYCDYYACIWKQYPDQHRVSIGSMKKCLSFFVYDYDEDATLEDCNIDDTQHMLKVSMKFLQEKYSNLSGKVMFKDTSFIMGERGMRMSLAHKDVLQYGKTWYERNFRAVPDNDTYYSDLKNFQKHVLTTKPQLLIKNPSIKKLYEKCKTLKEFIKELREADVYFYKDWCNDLVNRYIPTLSDNTTWIIDIKKLDVPEIKISSLEKEPENLFINMVNQFLIIEGMKYEEAFD
jgi:hypothetical protein